MVLIFHGEVLLKVALLEAQEKFTVNLVRPEALAVLTELQSLEPGTHLVDTHACSRRVPASVVRRRRSRTTSGSSRSTPHENVS